ncbi:MAG: hypothetical protein ACJA08_001148 [Cyclobacteriaceae bacterium]|jgi:hypothetical protein
METNKRTLSILHIIYGTLTLVTFLIVNTIFQSIFPFLMSEIDSEEQLVVGTITYIIRLIVLVLVFTVPLPSIVGGIALLNGKKWGMIPLLISGCLSLLSFPLGMALGVYTIWVFAQDQKQNKLNDENQG